MSISAWPKCVLWGGYAYGNTGDELTLAVALHDARREFGDSVAVLSGDPEYTQWMFPDVQVIPYTPALAPVSRQLLRRSYLRFERYAWPYKLHISPYRLQDQLYPKAGAMAKWVQTIINSHQLYLVGGGYFTDLFSLDYFLLPCHVAISASIPIITAPIGLGPFASRISAQLLAKTLCKMKVIVRDESSLEFCRKHNIVSELQPDDRFRMLEVISELSGLTSDNLRLCGISPRCKVGISLFAQHGGNRYSLEQWCIRLLNNLRNYASELDLEGFCFHTNHLLDFSMLVKLFLSTGLNVKLVCPPELNFRYAIKKLRQYNVIVSARFYAIVASNVLEFIPIKPSVAMASDARESYVRRSRLPSLDRGHQPSRGG